MWIQNSRSGYVKLQREYWRVPVGNLLRRDVEQGGTGLGKAHLGVNAAMLGVVSPRQVVSRDVYTVQFRHLQYTGVGRNLLTN